MCLLRDNVEADGKLEIHTILENFSLKMIVSANMLSAQLLCSPMVCSSPGSSVHGGFLGKNTRVGCHFLL